MWKKLGFILMVGMLIGAAFGLFAFAGGQDPDYTSPESLAEEAGEMTDTAAAESDKPADSEAAPADNVQTVAAPVLNAPAPPFSLTNLDGEIVSLEDYRGSVVLLNFWATWCTTCRSEMPAFEAGYTSYQDEGFVILAVNYDESAQMVSAYVEEMGLSFPVLLDPGAKTISLYRVRGFPTSFLIDQDGIIRQIHIGLLTEEFLRSYLGEAGLEI